MELLSAPWSVLCASSSFTLFGLFLTVFVLLFDYIKRRRSWRRYPPGPTSLPFVGNLTQVDYKNLPGYFAQLRKRYGDIFSMQFGWTNTVVLNGFDAVKEGLVQKSEEMSDRPDFPGNEAYGFKENCEAMYEEGDVPANAADGVDLGLNGHPGVMALQLLNLAPGLIRIPGVARKIFQTQDDFFDFLKNMVDEHKKTRDPNVTRDFIDAFLGELEKVNPDTISCYSDANLVLTVFDLFLAGTETTSSTLRWGLLYMILYPDTQKRVHEEIDKVIGRDKLPSMDDRANLPYTNAVIHEVQRVGNILPFSLPHRASKDTEINGFFIPKGVTVLPNLSTVLSDPNLWERPYQFYPEHFLDAEGKFIKPDAFIPFSTGRRICLGEPLARMELFLFFTSFLQKFYFSIPRDHPRPTEEARAGLLRVPGSFELCANLR